MSVYVIIPAAGIGTRMATTSGSPSAPKQFLSLGGLPILVHSLHAFLALKDLAGIYIAVRRPEIARMEELLNEHKLGDKLHVVEGGDHRQQSVSHALDSLPAGPNDIVLVHDAVRPLIDTPTIERTIEAIEKHGAAIVGMPAIDTIKQVERTADGAIITSTIPRERVVHAQTPQGARFSLLKNAFAEAEADEFMGTDEASLLERAGVTVAVVPGSQRNLKITQPSDLEIAEFYLAG